jgi:hypothetical protein
MSAHDADPTRREELLFMLLHGGAQSESIAKRIVDQVVAEAQAEPSPELSSLHVDRSDLDYIRRSLLPELRRSLVHHKEAKARWRARAEKAEAALTTKPAQVLRDAADAVVSSCPDHQPADVQGSWIDCHCPVADELRRMAAVTEAVTSGLSGLFERLGSPANETGAPLCTYCKGDCADPEDPGDYDTAVHMHNPGTRGPCPKCNGTGRQITQ